MIWSVNERPKKKRLQLDPPALTAFRRRSALCMGRELENIQSLAYRRRPIVLRLLCPSRPSRLAAVAPRVQIDFPGSENLRISSALSSHFEALLKCAKKS